MPFIENLKTIFETITALSTATIVIITLIKHIPKRIKQFFVKSIPLFFKGTIGENGKKIRFFRAVKLEKEKQNKIKRMISIIAARSASMSKTYLKTDAAFFNFTLASP